MEAQYFYDQERIRLIHCRIKLKYSYLDCYLYLNQIYNKINWFQKGYYFQFLTDLKGFKRVNSQKNQKHLIFLCFQLNFDLNVSLQIITNSCIIEIILIIWIYYQLIKDQMNNQRVVKAYSRSQQILPQFNSSSGDRPLIFEDSVGPAVAYPFCTLGVLSASGEWGTLKGVAFVVEDNYLLTCASNCYSHTHGEYPSISFTIDSHRKTGHDVHKVSKVLITEQYKQLSQNQRKEHNYALLYIEGQPKLKDRYGSLIIHFFNYPKIAFFECQFNAKDELLFKSFKKHDKMENFSLSRCPIGGPIIYPLNHGNRDINGLIAKESSTSQPYLMPFADQMRVQLNQWIQSEKGTLKMIQLTDINVKQLKQRFKEIKLKPIRQILMLHSRLNHQQYYQLFQTLPFSSVQKLLCDLNQMGDNLEFLKIDKFKGLKMLTLMDNQIGLLGCSCIIGAFLSNLRHINLTGNPIGNEGCEYLSKAQWPFLQILQLEHCMVGNKGLFHLCQVKRRNLNQLSLGYNDIDNSLSQLVQKADFPVIQRFQIDNCQITGGNGLLFLQSPSWRSLNQLTLNNNNIGRKGCKMIKQSNLALRALYLYKCNIDGAGMKWLCKTDLSKMSYYGLENNDFRDNGCFYLSKANMPQLKSIELVNSKIGLQGLKWLLKSKWDEDVLLCIFGMFNSIQKKPIDIDIRTFFKGRVDEQKLQMF